MQEGPCPDAAGEERRRAGALRSAACRSSRPVGPDDRRVFASFAVLGDVNLAEPECPHRLRGGCAVSAGTISRSCRRASSGPSSSTSTASSIGSSLGPSYGRRFSMSSGTSGRCRARAHRTNRRRSGYPAFRPLLVPVQSRRTGHAERSVPLADETGAAHLDLAAGGAIGDDPCGPHAVRAVRTLRGNRVAPSRGGAPDQRGVAGRRRADRDPVAEAPAPEVRRG